MLWLRLAATTLFFSAAPPLAADTGQTRLAQPQFEAGQVRFDWNSGGELQTAPGPDGPWTTIQAPQEKASTATVPFNPGNLFFRVVDKGIPSEVKPIVGGDARKPFAIRSATLRKGASANGNAFIEAILEPGQNPPSSFSLLQDGEVVTLRDDGQEGDSKAGDGVFTGGVFIDRAELEAGNQFVDSLPPEFQVLGDFNGRSVAATKPPALFDLGAFDGGRPVPVLPTPFDGNGQPTAETVRQFAKSGARRASAFGQPAAFTTVLITNIITVTNIVCEPVLVGTNGGFFRTNILCDPVVIGTNGFVFGTNIVCDPVVIDPKPGTFITNIACELVVIDPKPGSFATNIVCEPVVIGVKEVAVTNVVCELVQIGTQPPRILTNVVCSPVLLTPLPVPGVKLVCVTNVMPNPLRFVTNTIPTSVDGFPVKGLLTETNVFLDPIAPEFLTNVMCMEVFIDAPVGTPFLTNVCMTNIITDPVPVPVFTNICRTNITFTPGGIPIITNVCLTNVVFVPGGAPVVTNICRTNIVFLPGGGPVLTNICKTNIVILGGGGPILTNVCKTNLVFVPGTPFFTNVCLTNIGFFTNIISTNIGTGPGDTNRIDDYIKRPIFWPKSLLITDLSVVEDPTRTFDPCHPERGTRMGAWTFGRLMSDMCNQPVTGIIPGEFARRWVRSWMTDQVVNFDTVTNRNREIIEQVVTDWELASGGPDKPLDLSIAPFRLLAIVNRVDLRGNPGYGGIINDDPCNPVCIGGEGRFVFGLVPGLRKTGGGGGGYGGGGGDTSQDSCDLSQFTVIFEYCVPKNTCAEIKTYGLEWYNLSQLPFGAGFNLALQRLTDQFAAAGADPRRKPNLSALSQLRANELLREPWELREWRLFPNDSDAGWLRQVTAKQTPAFEHNFAPIITDYALANAGLILAEQHSVPLMWKPADGQMLPFLGGSGPMPTKDFFWDGAPRGSIPTDLRHKFSLNTCNGCHAGETGTPFTHVFPRKSGEEAKLSDFLTGLNMPKLDPADHVTPRIFADLKRREDDLLKLITEPCFFQLFREPAGFTH